MNGMLERMARVRGRETEKFTATHNFRGVEKEGPKMIPENQNK
jgi:hypothetical protein